MTIRTPAQLGEATPPTPCDVCHAAFEPGQVWNYHVRLGVYVHATCAANNLVRGEDITTHTMHYGQVPATPDLSGIPTGIPSPGSSREVTAAMRRAAEAAGVTERLAGIILTAALDAEEMAQAILSVRNVTVWVPGGHGDGNLTRRSADLVANALRAAILGADQ